MNEKEFINKVFRQTNNLRLLITEPDTESVVDFIQWFRENDPEYQRLREENKLLREAIRAITREASERLWELGEGPLEIENPGGKTIYIHNNIDLYLKKLKGESDE